MVLFVFPFPFMPILQQAKVLGVESDDQSLWVQVRG